MFLLKYFKGFLVIQCTRLLCIHYKVDLYCAMHYFGHKYLRRQMWQSGWFSQIRSHFTQLCTSRIFFSKKQCYANWWVTYLFKTWILDGTVAYNVHTYVTHWGMFWFQKWKEMVAIHFWKVLYSEILSSNFGWK